MVSEMGIIVLILRMRNKVILKPRFCIVCNIEIIRHTKSGKGRIGIEQYKIMKFCSLKCRGLWQTKNLIGNNNPNFRGGNTSCIACNKNLSYRYTSRNTKYCKKCWYKNILGDGNPMWNGGKTDINILERNHSKAKKWRRRIFERDDFTCQKCGDSSGGNLNAHHIRRWVDYPKLRFKLNNGITLCKSCHIIIHKKIKNGF